MDFVLSNTCIIQMMSMIIASCPYSSDHSNPPADAVVFSSLEQSPCSWWLCDILEFHTITIFGIVLLATESTVQEMPWDETSYLEHLNTQGIVIWSFFDWL